MSSIILRQATSADIEAFYIDGLPQTVRAIVADLDGEIIAVGGYYVVDGTALLFSDMTDKMRKHTVKIMKLGVKTLKMARATGLHVAAVQDRSEETSARFLTRLGFEPTMEIEGETLWRWHQ